MSRFSAFARFGQVGFTGRELPGTKVYDALKRAMGDEFDDSFDGSHTQAKLFAWAMGIASTITMLDRVRNSGQGKKVQELLPNLESFYGIKAYQGESKRDRRRRLHSRMQVQRGSRYEAIWEMLDTLLGTNFIDWVTADSSTLVRFPDTSSDADAVSNYVPAGSPAVVLRAEQVIYSGTSAVAVTELTQPVSSTISQAMVGRGILVDPAHDPRAENVEVDAVTTDSDGRITSVTATFANPHDIGTLFTTQHFPRWRSNVQYHFFELSATAAADPETVRVLNEDLVRAMKSVARWDIGSTDKDFGTNALLGVHPIAEAAANAESKWLRDIFDTDLLAYWGASVTSWRLDTSGNGNHLSGTNPPETTIDDTMSAASFATGGSELSADGIAANASGTDNEITILFWGEWVSGVTEVASFQHSSTAGRHQFTQSGTDVRYRRVADDSTTKTVDEAASTSERFYAITFKTAANLTENVLKRDASETAGDLTGTATATFDQFRLNVSSTGEFKIARMAIVDRHVTPTELEQVRAIWVAASEWNL